MNKKAIITTIIVSVSVALTILQAETKYADLAASTKWARAAGYGFAPWLFGFLVASIKHGWAKLRGHNHVYSDSLVWASGVLTALLVVVSIWSSAKGQNNQQAHDDAMLLMGAASSVPGVAAYCHKYVEPNEGIIDSAKSWNRRHKRDLSLVVEVVKKTGGLSKEEKELINKLAMKLLRQEVESQNDKKAYCDGMKVALDKGIFDLDVRKDTASAIERIRKFAEQ